MATLSERDLSCPICHEVFKDPVLLSCSHSFCRECLKHWWAQKPLKPCVICNRRSSRDDPPLNLALKNLCLDFMERGSEAFCKEHSERLRVFCFQDQRPVCLVCRESEAHKNHTFKPIGDVAPEFRDELRKILLRLEEQLQVLDKIMLQFSAAVAHTEVQARLTEEQIQDQFMKLHQFLIEQEQMKIRALREEEEQKRKSLEDKMAAVSREMEVLSETITATEEQLRASDHSFLLQYKATVDRVQHCPLVGGPQLGPGALIDQAKHLGNLGFNIWRNMKDLIQFYPVAFDPNTTHPDLTISENLATVSFGESQSLPENPERFQTLCALGSEGFLSGSHSWKVEVSGDDLWSVGVMQKSVQRKGHTTPLRFWVVYHCNGKYFAFLSPDVLKPLYQKNLQRVRVELDFDKGILSFSDANTNTHLQTFTYSFSERLFPYFQNYNTVPLKILPKSVSLTMG